MLADDHAVVRAGIRNALAGVAEIEVVGEVGNGPELEGGLKRLRPDCLLIDISMPEFKPISAITAIRAAYPDLKILVVSAYDDDIYVQGLLSAGVNGYHLKDQPLSDLKLAVQRVLAGKRWVTDRLLDKLFAVQDGATAVPALTPRQIDILRLLQRGYDNYKIALDIGISIKTVENHLTRIYRRLNVFSRLEAVNFMREHPEVMRDEPVRSAYLAHESVQHPQPGQTTILLVDDNRRFRMQLRRMIGRLFPRALLYEAQNSQRAIQLAQQILPRLAFVDVVLDDEDGIDCTRRVKLASSNTRIMLMSAYPDREFRRRGLEAGATAFLDKKDLNMAVLQQIIADNLSES